MSGPAQPKKGSQKDDPQKVLIALTEIANECIRLYNKGEPINMTQVATHFCRIPHLH